MEISFFRAGKKRPRASKRRQAVCCCPSTSFPRRTATYEHNDEYVGQVTNMCNGDNGNATPREPERMPESAKKSAKSRTIVTFISDFSFGWRRMKKGGLVWLTYAVLLSGKKKERALKLVCDPRSVDEKQRRQIQKQQNSLGPVIFLQRDVLPALALWEPTNKACVQSNFPQMVCCPTSYSSLFCQNKWRNAIRWKWASFGA